MPLHDREAAINEAERRRIRTIATNHFMPENLEPFLPFPQWFRDIAKNSWRDMGRLMSKAAAVTTPTGLAARTMSEHAGLDVCPSPTESTPVSMSDAGETVNTPTIRSSSSWGGSPWRRTSTCSSVRSPRWTRSWMLTWRSSATASSAPSCGTSSLSWACPSRVTFHGHVSDEPAPPVVPARRPVLPAGDRGAAVAGLARGDECLKPVVLADALALPHLVSEGENGYLFTPGDAQDLAGKLTAVLTATPRGGHAWGRPRTLAVKHSQDKTVSLFEQLYRGLKQIRAQL